MKSKPAARIGVKSPKSGGKCAAGLVTDSLVARLAPSRPRKYSHCIFYDKLDRPIQAISNNHVNLGMNDKTSVLYFVNNLSTKPQKIKTTHTAATTINVTQRYTYDNAWRAVGIYQSIDNEPNEQLVALYKYNALGQRVEKNLHLLYDAQDGQTGTLTADDLVETQYNGENQLIARNSVKMLPGYSVKAGATMWKAALTTVTQAQAEVNGRYLQSVDYRYNIRGWLTSINNAQLNNDGAVNDDTNDFFGMELFYNNAENSSLNNTAQYNGNISAVKWKNAGVTSGATDQRSYKYAYDYSDKLSSATFQAYNAGWTKETNTLNESMTYDANGNISTLARNQNQRGLSGTTVTSTAQTIDNLTYTYASGNQLSKVDDAAVSNVGFNDGTSQTTEYTYNTHGSQTSDLNKGISNITYNVLGKEQQVTFSNGNTIIYTYDAAGTKLKTATTVSGTTTTTDYVSRFVYTNSALSFFSSPEGRVIKNGSNYEYQYAIGDHQGNTRVVFTSAAPIAKPTLADFDGDAGDQSSQFTNIPTPIPYGAANHTPGGSYVVRMNQGTPVGPSFGKKVYPGDKVDMEAWSYYESASGYTTSNVASATLLSQVTTALLNVSGPDIGGIKSSGVNSAFTSFGVGANQGDSQPAAFLNYILFDQSFKVMDAGWQVVTATAFSKQQVSISNITVKEAGYIFVYLSYEDASNNYVYFDDFKVTITPTNSVIQSNEYYPFGLQTSNSWTRDNSLNNFLANGGTELNSTSQLYDLDFRNYDPILGRLNQVDPMASKYSSASPYHYSLNNPIGFNDPSGADPGDIAYGRWDPWDRPAMGRDVAYSRDGGGATPRYNGSNGYFYDENGNGVQDGGEQSMSWAETKSFYGEKWSYLNSGSLPSSARLVTDSEGNTYIFLTRAYYDMKNWWSARPLNNNFDNSTPSTIWHVDFGVMGGFNFNNFAKAELVLFAFEGWTNDPKEKNDGKINLTNSAAVGAKLFTDPLSIQLEIGQDQKIKTSSLYSDPMDYFRTLSFDILGFKFGGKTGIDGKTTTSVDNSGSLSLGVVRISWSTQIGPK